MSHQVDHGGRASTRTDEELRLLREALYRPHPPADAVARYRALAAQAQPSPTRPDGARTGRDRDQKTAARWADPQHGGSEPDDSRPDSPEQSDPDKGGAGRSGAEREGAHRSAAEHRVAPGRDAAAGGPEQPAAEERHRHPRFGRRTLLVAGAVGIVVLTAVGVLQGTAPPGPATAEPVVLSGPTAAIDRAVLARVLHPGYTNSDAIVAAIRRSDLPQLAQWRTRAAGAVVLQGTGPVVRRYGGTSFGARPPRPFSLLVVCDRPTRYRWTVRGSTPADGEDHVLASAATDRCGHQPTAAGFTLPAGAVVHRFTFSLPKGRSWGMVFVYPMG